MDASDTRVRSVAADATPATPNTPHIRMHKYRADIDGLRAIAVLVVVLYHAGLGFPGGFIGVDIFFVISGYLITSLIRDDLESRRFSLLTFWERRARRILPAFFLVTVTTAIAGAALLYAPDFEELARSAVAQSLFCANIFFWRTAGYFSVASEQKPMLHTWSLAVEEQFYFTVPLLLMAVFYFANRRERSVIPGILAAIFVGSLVISQYLVIPHPEAAFYSLPSRAWELSLGALVATLPLGAVLSRRWLREIAAAAGLGLILFSVFRYTKGTPFPGFAALAPCAGSALIIAAGSPTLTFVGAVLALRPLVFVGLISYSLYLWHWPLIALSTYASLLPLPLGHRIAIVAAAFALAVLSWRFVETPFRHRRIFATRRSILSFAGIGLVVTFAAGMWVIRDHGFPGRFNATALAKYEEAQNDRAFLNETTVADVAQEKLPAFGKRAPDRRVDMLVWGDSHAMAALPAFDVFATEQGMVGRAATHSSAPPLVGYDNAMDLAWAETEQFNQAVLQYIRRTAVPNVVLIAFWRRYSDPGELKWEQPTRENLSRHYAGSDNVQRALLETVRQVKAAGAQPWVFLDVPTQSFSIPKALFVLNVSSQTLAAALARPGYWNGVSDADDSFLNELVSAGARIIDPRPSLLDSSGRYYRGESDGYSLYADRDHLTTRAARQFLVPVLRKAFSSRVPNNR